MQTQTLEREKLAQRIPVEGEFRVSNDTLEDASELRRRLTADGYLFFRGLVDVERLLRLRRDILELCREHGWLRDGTALLDGVYSGKPFPDYHADYMPLYRRLIRLKSFNEFSKSEEIVALFGRLFAAEVLVHPRNIARISFPQHHQNTTQPHQDFWYIRGAPETYTTWIPVGDCPRKLGGLALAEGSHRAGFVPHAPAIGAGGHGIPLDRVRGRWLSTDFCAGDLVLFHAFTVHGALDNRSADHLRISLDYRYQRADEPVDANSLQPHTG